MRIDNHCHVFRVSGLEPPRVLAEAAYVSPEVDLTDYRRHLAQLGCTHGVLVQPSSYGTDDHGILLAALASDPTHLRGVACAPVASSDETLAEMDAVGVVATRVQDGYPGGVPVTRIGEVAQRVRHLGWHIEVWSDIRQHLPWFTNVVSELGVDIVIDHLGYVPSDVQLDSPEMCAFIELLTLPNVWITLSGSERLLPREANPRDIRAVANHEAAITDRVQAFIDVAPDRALWGSDWPHVGLPETPASAEILSRWERWVPNPATRLRVMRDNNARRYGFSLPR